MRLFIQVGFCLAFLCASLVTEAAQDKIAKVLVQYLDAEGRQSLSPSLYERDAYQAQLRKFPALRSALRFEVQWKGDLSDDLKIRMEMKGIKGSVMKTISLEEPARKRGIQGRWTAVTLAGEEFKDFGDLVSWRATLWRGGVQVAEQKSFLWK